MLRELIERYLDNLKLERAFDSMFLSLLVAEGFTDVHFTHGAFEFGRDFIGKKHDGEKPIQYVFQNKVGKIGAGEWRDIRHQMFETVTNELGGPSFDVTLERRCILVLTGRLVGTAPADYREFTKSVEKHFTCCSILPAWDREVLIELILKHGPEQLFRVGSDIATYGDFYRLYGNIANRQVKVDEIEKHFDMRLKAVADPLTRLSAVAVEAQLFADAGRSSNQLKVGIDSMLSIVRSIAYEIQENGMATNELLVMLNLAKAEVLNASSVLSSKYLELAATAGSLHRIIGGALFITYPIICTHVMDALVLQYFCGSKDQASSSASALATLVSLEYGCAHPISDRYAVSVIWSIRVLHESGHAHAARSLLKEAAIWLIDRYWQENVGLASCDASETDEVSQLLGGAFEGVPIARNRSSLLACILMDAAAFIQDEEIFKGLRKDILAAEIAPSYFQTQDTVGQFTYSAEDVVRFPNVEFAELLTPFDDLAHGNHLFGEKTPHLSEVFGHAIYAVTSLLMRDRYFPSTWVSEAHLDRETLARTSGSIT